jgi:hypothetical protein
MLNAIGWDGTDFRLRDPVALAIAPEVERRNRKANMPISLKTEAYQREPNIPLCAKPIPEAKLREIACAAVGT